LRTTRPGVRRGAVAGLAVTIGAAVDVAGGVPVHVNVHVPMSPITIVGQGRAPDHTYAECDQGSHRVVHISGWRIVDGWRIARHIDDFRIGWNNLDDLLRDVHHLGCICLQYNNIGHGDDLLGTGLEGAGFFRLCPEVL